GGVKSTGYAGRGWYSELIHSTDRKNTGSERSRNTGRQPRTSGCVRLVCHGGSPISSSSDEAGSSWLINGCPSIRVRSRIRKFVYTTDRSVDGPVSSCSAPASAPP